MSRIYKEIEETRKYNTLVKKTCDLCGFEAKDTHWGADSYYDINETEVKVTCRHAAGVNYPEGGYTTNYEIDICPKCFIDKLIPWFEDQGAQIEPREADW